jgi:hypothetical protein
MPGLRSAGLVAARVRTAVLLKPFLKRDRLNTERAREIIVVTNSMTSQGGLGVSRLSEHIVKGYCSRSTRSTSKACEKPGTHGHCRPPSARFQPYRVLSTAYPRPNACERHGRTHPWTLVSEHGRKGVRSGLSLGITRARCSRPLRHGASRGWSVWAGDGIPKR